LLWARLDSRYVVVAVLAMLWTGAIGFLDDYMKIVRGKSQGLVARWKLIGQVTFGLALGVALILWPLAPDLAATSTQLPLFKYFLLVLPAPLYLLFVTVVVTGTSNAVNLTDGLDGLAAGLTAILAGTFAAFAYVFGRFDWTRYLLVYFLPGSQELTIFCGALAGAALGFLWFNAHPAQLCMGATAPSLREAGLGRAAGRDPVLHPGRHVRGDRARHAEGAMIPEAWRGEGGVAVIGLGKSGVAATRLLAREGVRVYASDASDHPYGGDALAGLRTLSGVTLDVGRHDLTRIRAAAAVIVSPGVPPEAPPLAAARAARVPILSEIDLGFRALAGSGTRCIAITGTNGKTTTTALVAHLLRTAGLRAEAAGNIGRPLADVALELQRWQWLAVEVSSFQLHDSPQFAPDVGVLTNLAPDHLDRYPSVD